MDWIASELGAYALCGFAIVVLIMRWVKGSWGEAILASLAASLLAMPLLCVCILACTVIANFVLCAYTSVESIRRPMAEVAGVWGGGAVMAAIFVIYCIQDRGIARLKKSPRFVKGKPATWNDEIKGPWRKRFDA